MPAQPPDLGRRSRVTPAVFPSFVQLLPVFPIDPQFRGQSEGKLKLLWPGCGLPIRGSIPVRRSAVSLTALVALAKTRP